MTEFLIGANAMLCVLNIVLFAISFNPISIAAAIVSGSATAVLWSVR